MSDALVQFRERRSTLTTRLNAMRPTLAKILPEGGDTEAMRLVQIVSSAVTRNPTILTCHLPTIVQAVMQGAECGLEIGGVRGEAYLVPFWNSKMGRRDCQFIAGYKGLGKLMLQTPGHRNLEARLVYGDDVFEYEYGTAPRVVHKPAKSADRSRGEVVYAYAVLHFADGGTQFDVMDLAQLEAIRDRVAKRNRGKESGPWATDTHAMYKKCPIRSLANVVELSARARKAIEFEQAHEVADVARPIDAPSRAEALKSKLSGAPVDAPADPLDDLTPEEIEGELVEIERGDS